MKNKFKSFTKYNRFKDLIQSIQNCNLCSRMQCRRKVFSDANGSIDSKVLFIAEAPGRLGADQTGIPLCGDKTGDNFEHLLGNIGWRRQDIFITNAILCNPRKENGNNATPIREEIENCIPYLEMALELIQPDVVVTLGAIALESLNKISPHGLTLKNNVGKFAPWDSKLLVPLYHPGPRAMVHRSLSKQRSDFMQLAKLVDPTQGIKNFVKSNSTKKQKTFLMQLDRPSVLQQVIFAIVSALGRLTYFKLTKLLYLADLIAIEKINHTITGEIYLRQPEGPWPPKLQKELPELDGYEIRRYYSGKIPLISLGPSPRFGIELDEEILEILADVLGKYGKYSNAAIKTAVYMTSPMRYLLSQEKKGKDMRKVPVIYKDKRAPDTENTNIRDNKKCPNNKKTLFDIN